MNEQLRAPSDWSETIDDFRSLNSKGRLVFTWIAGSAVALLMGGVLYIFGGLLLGLIAAALFLAWPIATSFSASENREVYRYYTWVYRTTKPVPAAILITRQFDGESVYYFVDVTFADGRKVKCDPIPTDHCQKDEFLDRQIDVELHLLPDQKSPLVAVFGDNRLWLEQRF